MLIELLHGPLGSPAAAGQWYNVSRRELTVADEWMPVAVSREAAGPAERNERDGALAELQRQVRELRLQLRQAYDELAQARALLSERDEHATQRKRHKDAAVQATHTPECDSTNPTEWELL